MTTKTRAGRGSPCPRPARLLRLATAALLVIGPAGVAAAQEPEKANATGALRVLDVPYLAQSPELCGGAAAAMVLRYWGDIDATDDQFAHLLDTELDGIPTDDLAEAVRARGFLVRTVRGDAALIRDEIRAGRPSILLLAVGGGRYHYVVPVAEVGNSFVVHDPASRPFESVSREDLLTRWEETGRWMAVIAPDPEARPEVRGAAATGPDSEALAIDPASPCAEHLTRVLKAGADTAEEEIEGWLAHARSECPTAALAWRESAAVAFRGERWSEAAELAARAVELEPEDPHAWRILATSRFLDDDLTGALEAWNRVGEPRVGTVRAPVLAGIRFPVLERRLGLRPGDMVTSDALEIAERRLAATPSLALARVRLAPPRSGRADLVVAAAGRGSPRLAPGWLLQTGWTALAERRVRLGVPGPTGSGEYLALDWTFARGRPSVALELGVPDPLGLDGVGRFTAAIAEQTYATSTGEVVRESSRRGEVALTRWLGPRVSAWTGVGVERWTGRGADVTLHAGLERRFGDQRGRLAAEILGGFSLADAPSYGSFRIGARWRSSTRWDVAHWVAAGSATAVTDASPRGRWPRAGTGSTGEALLRAHPLLTNGTVTGPAFGRTLTQGTLEGRLFPWRTGPAAIGLAGFVDAAWIARPALGDDGGWLVGVGAGLRVASGALPGLVRVDVATGLRSGGPTLSIGWWSE